MGSGSVVEQIYSGEQDEPRELHNDVSPRRDDLGGSLVVPQRVGEHAGKMLIRRSANLGELVHAIDAMAREFPGRQVPASVDGVPEKRHQGRCRAEGQLGYECHPGRMGLL